VVSPLPNPGIVGLLFPESGIPVLDITVSDTEVHPGGSNLLPDYWSKKERQLHTTRSGKIFRNKPNYSNLELLARFGKQNKKRQSLIRHLLESGDVEY